MDSKILACALDNMNEAVILDVKQHYAKPDEKPYPDEQVPFFNNIYRWLACISYVSQSLIHFLYLLPAMCLASVVSLIFLTHFRHL